MADLGLGSRYEGGPLLGQGVASIALLPLARGLGGAGTASGHGRGCFRAVQHAQEDSIRHVRVAHAGTAGTSPRTSCPHLPRYILCLQTCQASLPMPQLLPEFCAFSALSAVPTANSTWGMFSRDCNSIPAEVPSSFLPVPGVRMRASTPPMEAADPAAPADTACGARALAVELVLPAEPSREDAMQSPLQALSDCLMCSTRPG